MTMAFERTGSVGQTHAFLTELVCDTEVPTRVSHNAQFLFPTKHDVLQAGRFEEQAQNGGRYIRPRFLLLNLGLMKMKQTLLNSRYTLRSKTPEMVKQKLWGVLLGYNLLRYQMVEVNRHCPGIHPCELSFATYTWVILGFINGVSAERSGNIPKYLAELHASPPPKYSIKNKNASQLN
jgi:hypothetical protein